MTIITRPGMPPQRTAPRRPSERPVPYSLRDSATMASTTNMATAMTPTLATWSQPQHPPNMAWPDHSLQDSHLHYPPQNMIPTYMQPVRPPSMTTHQLSHDTGPRPGQSGPWTADEDDILIRAKRQGLAWDEIHKQYFPHKTGNACRKRHDRLLIKARDPTWDEARTQKVVSHYNRVREQAWRPIADMVGEKWEDVERVILQQGSRGLRTTRPRHARTRSRASSGQAALGEWDHISPANEDTDDSGISLGQSGHSRRPSEIGTTQSNQSLRVEYLLGEENDVQYPYTSYQMDGRQ